MWSPVLFIFLALSLSFCLIKADDDDDWDSWHDHLVVYQIYPRSFKDSDNDGIGDLPGIISKLDFLEELGVNAVWLSPIYASPLYDEGYDISDYYTIHPDYGTMDDFEELVSKANEKGIKIIMDFVCSYSSIENQWFVNSENRVEGYEDWYVWLDGKEDGSPPNNWNSMFRYSAWNYSETRGQWYFHHFTPQQPDLNYRSEGLVAEMKNVLVYWMEKGISGFRVDAISQLFEDGEFRDDPINPDCTGCQTYDYDYLLHIHQVDQIESVYMVYDWVDVLDNYSKENNKERMIMMVEIYTISDYAMLFYGNGTREGATFPFNFRFITEVTSTSTAQHIVDVIDTYLANVPEGKIPNWVLGNHDQYRVATRFGTERVDGYNMISQLLPGAAITYMGEEIGMENGEVTYEEGRDPQGCNYGPEGFPLATRDQDRTPYQWDNTTNAGFNEGAQTWLPVGSKYVTCNLADQRIPADKRSHYHTYIDLVSLRKEEPFVTGSLSTAAVSEYVIGFTRELEGYDTYAVIFNLDEAATTVDLTEAFSNLSGDLEVVLVSLDSSRNIGDTIDASELQLDAFESLVVKTTSS